MEPVTIAYMIFGALWVAGAITYLQIMAVENINNMTEGLAPADRSDVKDKNFKMPKAPGDKYVKGALNLLFKRTPLGMGIAGAKAALPYVDDFVELLKTRKGKIIQAGDETTEGAFRYKGKTYNKSDGVLVETPNLNPKTTRTVNRVWTPKESYGLSLIHI